MKLHFWCAVAGSAMSASCSTVPHSPSSNYSIVNLTQPTITHGLHGMKINSAGELIVGDVLGFTVWKIDVATGRALPLVEPPYGCADDLAFAVDGTMVWTSLLTGQVYALSPGGRRYVVAEGLPGVNSIGFGPDGRLFVTQLGGQDKLWQLDIRGRQAPKLILEGVAGLNGFQIDADNVLWGPRGKNGDIIQLDLNTLSQRVVASGFIWPTGVVLDRNGLLYVVDLTAGTLTRVDPRSGAKTLVKQLEPGIDNLAISKRGLIYVSNSATNTISEIEPMTGAAREVRRGQMGVPGGLAVAAGAGGADAVYFANTFSFGRIDGGGTVTDLGRRLGAASIISATSVRHSRGKLLLSHFDEGRIHVASIPSGAIERTIENLALPYDAIMLVNGDLIVAEHAAGRLVRVKPDDSRTVIVEGLAGPVGLVAEDDGYLLVTEAAAGALTRVEVASGRKQRIRSGLNRPEGLDRGADGSVYVAEAGSGELARIDPKNGVRTVIARDLAPAITPPLPMDPVWIPMGVAAGPDGVVYVSLDGIGTVAKVAPARAPISH